MFVLKKNTNTYPKFCINVAKSFLVFSPSPVKIDRSIHPSLNHLKKDHHHHHHHHRKCHLIECTSNARASVKKRNTTLETRFK